ncbi:MAG: hypothetical protein ACRD2R_07345 [Terriglobales bacterium]
MAMRRACALGILCALAALPPAGAQIHGTPPSVTSIGSSSTPMTPGVPASVTSLGPAGFDGGARGIVRSVPASAAPVPRFGHFVPAFFPYYYSEPQPPTVVVVEAPPTVVVLPERADSAERLPSEPLVVELQGGVYVERSRRRDSDDDEAESEVARPRNRRSARRPPPRAAVRDQAPPAPAPDEPATVLVFLDGSRRDVRNYAIVGEILWDLSQRRAHKILLAELDLDATAALNDERGLNFRLPTASAPNQVITRP